MQEIPNSRPSTVCTIYMGVCHSHGGTPIAGWLTIKKSYKNERFRGTPISGNLHIPTWKCSSSCKWIHKYIYIYNYIAMGVISQLMGVYTATMVIPSNVVNSWDIGHPHEKWRTFSAGWVSITSGAWTNGDAELPWISPKKQHVYYL